MIISRAITGDAKMAKQAISISGMFDNHWQTNNQWRLSRDENPYLLPLALPLILDSDSAFLHICVCVSWKYLGAACSMH